ncbi:MAG TPA: hypothetical protein VH063_19215 [Gaiellaceae bacterium]|jgi:hypothetical protein|nr:hypothetical protein [Gaiellaceae bacterium]
MNNDGEKRPGATDTSTSDYEPPAIVATFSTDDLRRDAAAAGTPA